MPPRLSLGGHKWKRGDVEFIGRGMKHESQNTSGKPVDVFIVGIK